MSEAVAPAETAPETAADTTPVDEVREGKIGSLQRGIAWPLAAQ